MEAEEAAGVLSGVAWRCCDTGGGAARSEVARCSSVICFETYTCENVRWRLREKSQNKTWVYTRSFVSCELRATSMSSSWLVGSCMRGDPLGPAAAATET